MNDPNDFFDDVIDDEADANDTSLMEFDEEEEEEDEPVELRTAVLLKNGMVALLSLKTFSNGGQVIRTDPRQAIPTAQSYDDGDTALMWFSRSLATSRKNGWGVVYDGEPLFG